jgi:DNA-binding transcriptional LysR family regulator
MNNTIDLRQFRYFLAVSDALHFGRAAERLNISQPPLSRQIRQLEDQLGVDLFVRSKTGVMLTDAGLAFLPEAQQTLAQAEKAVTAAQAARGLEKHRFVIGYTTVFDRSAIPDVFDRLRQSFPDWQIVTQGKHSIGLVREVRNGTMDAAFVGLHTQADGLTTEVVSEEPLLVALSTTHRLAGKRCLAFNDLHDEALFWFERRLNPGYYDYSRSVFEQNGFTPRMIPEPPDHHILLGLIAEGRGIALIPASLRRIKREGVVFRRLQEGAVKIRMGLAVVYSAQNRSPVLERFLGLIRLSKRPSGS